MKPGIRSGPAQVLAANTVTAFGGHALQISVPLGPDTHYVLTFDFRSDGKEPSVKSEATPNGITLFCSNFDDSSGRGSAIPVLLREMDNELLFLHFRVFRYGKTEDRTVHYTLFRTTKEAVNWQTE